MLEAATVEVLRDVWSAPDRRPIPAWAEDGYIVLPESYAEPGPIDLSTSRHLIPVLNALQDDAVREVNALKGVQSGGSLVGEIWACWVVENDPGPFMWNFQTEEVMKRQYEIRIKALFESGRMRRLFPQEKSKKAGKLIAWPTMQMQIQGGGKNLSNLQTVSYRYALNDEPWMWNAGFLAQAIARTDAFPGIKKVFNVSQAGVQGEDWDLKFHEGTVNAWTVQCDSCRKYAPPIWTHRLPDGTYAGVNYETRRYMDGTINKNRAAETARWRCPHCGHEHVVDAVLRQRWNKTGRYSKAWPKIAYGKIDPKSSEEAKEGVPGSVSFWWPSIIRKPLGELVAEWLSAEEAENRGSLHQKKEFYMKKCAQFWSEDLVVEKIALERGQFEMGTRLPNAAMAFMTVDRQAGRGDDTPHFKVVVRDWSGRGPSRLVWCGRIDSREDLRAKQEELRIANGAVFLDGRFKMMDTARVCAVYGWRMLIGTDVELFKHSIGRGASRRVVERPYSPVKTVDARRGLGGGAKAVQYLSWSNPTVKDITWRLRHGQGPAWELPADIPPEYDEEIDSEFRKRVATPRGNYTYHWVPVNPSDPRNDFWDCENMQTVLALKAGYLPFEQLAETDAGEEKAKARKKRPEAETEENQLELEVVE